MIVVNGPIKKQLTLYPFVKPSFDIGDPFWVEEESDELVIPILTIDRALYLKKTEEDIMYSNFLQNLYDNPFLLGDIVILQDWEITRVFIEEPIWKRLCFI